VPDWNRVRYELFNRVGYFVTESSEHFSEHAPGLSSATDRSCWRSSRSRSTNISPALARYRSPVRSLCGANWRTRRST
jgi:hypothetical protein